MSKPKRYSAEVRERAVRMLREHEHEHASQWATIVSVAEKNRVCGGDPAQLGASGRAGRGSSGRADEGGPHVTVSRQVAASPRQMCFQTRLARYE